MAQLIKYNEIKEMSKEVLVEKVAAARQEIFKMRVTKATAGLEKPHLLSIYKRNIARLLTEFNSKK